MDMAQPGLRIVKIVYSNRQDCRRFVLLSGRIAAQTFSYTYNIASQVTKTMRGPRASCWHQSLGGMPQFITVYDSHCFAPCISNSSHFHTQSAFKPHYPLKKRPPEHQSDALSLTKYPFISST